MGDDRTIHQREAEMLAFWERERIFAQSVEREAPNGEFVFYEGPPTANAPPGIHHVIGRTFKDVIPRYKTMRGFRVRRKAGWDTHGLPVELQIEKVLGLKTKKDIEAYGVVRFNAACRDSVWKFKEEWERLTDRIGFWLDQQNPYVTYEMPYVESVWWFLRQAWEKGLLTRDYRSVWYCPRCQTPLSSHEVALGYKDDVEDPSVYVKFEIRNPKLETNPKLELSNDQKAYLLAWTTTPWTLPGNVALAVHPEVEYAIVRHGIEHLILAKPLVERVLGEGAEIIQTIRGADLVGTTYEPLYRAGKHRVLRRSSSDGKTPDVEKRDVYAVLPADFVSLDDGTGIVHIAPAYGAEDFELGKTHGIPPLFTVHPSGTMMDGYPGAGKFFKAADADVRADLTSRGLLFRDETIRHTYPFCWRCDTPLLAYARASWYIAMSKMRQEIQAKNAAIHWFPDHIRDGRFGEWLRELKDWAITRERYWGAPMPIWECDRCGEREVLGSFAELIAKVVPPGEAGSGSAGKCNRYLLMRHGEAESNARGVISARLETSDQYPLTAEGRTRVVAAAEQLKGAGITTIIASPYHRMRQTAEIVSAAVGIPVIYDDRLREIDLPDFDGKPYDEHSAVFSKDRTQRALEKFTKKIGENETWDELAARMLLALRDIDRQHEGETILICSHGDPLFLLEWAFSGRTREGIAAMPYPAFDAPHAFAFTGALVNDRGELDVHRPFVDTIAWPCSRCPDVDVRISGTLTPGIRPPRTRPIGTMRRFPEVVDVWLESGCMPFAQAHYPFEQENGISNLKSQISNPPKLYPADYISEAIDQTRGWFYTLLAVATVLGWESPYRNVICYSHILDREGKKMSKSKGNVVNPNDMIATYGADVVRWYMLTVNQPWDPKLFDEADLKQMSRKPFGMLGNVLSFWELHGGNTPAVWPTSQFEISNLKSQIPADAGLLLDSWLRARTAATHAEVTRRLDAYEITEAARAISDLIDDVSTWWLRRSRERLKEGGAAARGTFTAALRSIAMLLAPFAPFTAERMWQTLRAARAISNLKSQIPESVHLAMWDFGRPEITDGDTAMLERMASVRRMCSLALEARAKAGIPVRQALATLRVGKDFSPSHREGEREGVGSAILQLIRDEVNVKEVIVDPSLPEEVILDTALTPELQREGMVRELTRAVNGIRKEMGLMPTDCIRVTYATDDTTLAQAIAEHREQLLRGTQAVVWEAGTPATPRTLTVSGAAIALDIARAPCDHLDVPAH